MDVKDTSDILGVTGNDSRGYAVVKAKHFKVGERIEIDGWLFKVAKVTPKKLTLRVLEVLK